MEFNGLCFKDKAIAILVSCTFIGTTHTWDIVHVYLWYYTHNYNFAKSMFSLLHLILQLIDKRNAKHHMYREIWSTCK